MTSVKSAPTTRLRRLPQPATDPPYDDEAGTMPVLPPHPRRRRAADHDAPVQGALALAVTTKAGLPTPEPQTALQLVGAAERVLPANARLPDPRRWSAKIAQAIVEALFGRRPVQQLLRWTSEDVYATVARRVARHRNTGPATAAPSVRSVRVCAVNATVAEACAVLQTSERVCALAIRLEADDDRWLCTALDLV